MPDPEGRRHESDESMAWNPGAPNDYAMKVIAEALRVCGNVECDAHDAHIFRTELDSHANMVVVGRNTAIINDTGRTAEVSPFTPDCSSLQNVPVVNAAIGYDCEHAGESYLLVVMNAISVPSMDHNLIPPFIMREAGIDVKSTPKIHVEDPCVEDHSICLKEENLRIPLKLNGIFSYFPSHKPSDSMLNDESINVLLLTSEGPWNPHSDVCSRNEDGMLDYEGNMVDKKERTRILMSEVEDDPAIEISAVVSELESSIIDTCCNDRSPNIENGSVSDLGYKLWMDGTISQQKMSIGATDVLKMECLDDALIGGDLTEVPTNNSDTRDIDCSDADSIDDLCYELKDEPESVVDEFMASVTHVKDSKSVSAETLSKLWRIDAETAEKTLDVASQRCSRKSNPSLAKAFSANARMLRHKRIDEHFFMDAFFATKKGKKSSRGNTYCQLFVTDKDFICAIPMKSKSEALQAVKQFAKEIGAPEAFITDAAREETSSKLKQFCNNIGTALRVLEEGTPWMNRAELCIGHMKSAVRKDMKEADSPLVFWDYCIERRARINNLTAKKLFQLHGSNPCTTLTGEEGEISNLCQFKWYDWCYYREHAHMFPFNKEVLDRVLGPAKGEGNEMAQWVLKANGRVAPRRTLRPLQVSEMHSPAEIGKRKVFDNLIKEKWGDSITPPVVLKEEKEKDFIEYEDDDEQPRVAPDIEEPVDSSGRLINQQPACDKLINVEIYVQHGDALEKGKVIGRSIGPDGTTTGQYDDNPILNSVIYDVEFPDGQVKEHAANVIAENMLCRVDEDGFSNALLESIISWKKDDSVVDKVDKHIVTGNGQRRLRKSTQGWKLEVLWKDGSTSWIPLKDLKESNPIEVAEFSKARGINDEPAFAWWVPCTLRKRDAIISAVTSRARKTSHKYGIELPSSVEHAYEIDVNNGNNFWRKAIEKEMHEVGVAFEILDGNRVAPVGWRKVTGHLVFDAKMDFTRKARWVLDGHKTPSPIGSTYAGAVSRESVRIAFTYAALNDVDIFAADIRNAYLQAPSSEKHCVVCGAEFGLENAGKKALIRRALYGGKAARRDFRNHLRSRMSHLHFQSCLADPDVWMRPAIKSDGMEYYEYVLLYTDDALVVSENAERVLTDEIGKYFELKKESIGHPKICLGGSVRKLELENGAKAWAFGSSQYVRSTVRNAENTLEKNGRNLPNRAETPIKTDYRPELDATPELVPVQAACYQSLIGILRWIVELGRVDACLEVSMMLSHLALPKEGHLEQVCHIFSYLRKHHNAEMVFDPSEPVIDYASFERKD